MDRCRGCGHADFVNSEVVYGQQRLLPDGGLEKLDGVELPVCNMALFRAAMQEGGLPSASLEVTHVGRGAHAGQIVGTSYLGACLEGEECTGRNQ